MSVETRQRGAKDRGCERTFPCTGWERAGVDEEVLAIVQEAHSCAGIIHANEFDNGSKQLTQRAQSRSRRSRPLRHTTNKPTVSTRSTQNTALKNERPARQSTVRGTEGRGRIERIGRTTCLCKRFQARNEIRHYVFVSNTNWPGGVDASDAKQNRVSYGRIQDRYTSGNLVPQPTARDLPGYRIPTRIQFSVILKITYFNVPGVTSDILLRVG